MSIEKPGPFGEADLTLGELSRATAIADKPGKLMKIGRKDILEVLRRDPPLATKLLWNLARELGKRAEEALLHRSSSEEKSMIVDIDPFDAPEVPHADDATNPRAVVVIPKLTKNEPEIVEELEDFEDVVDDPN